MYLSALGDGSATFPTPGNNNNNNVLTTTAGKGRFVYGFLVLLHARTGGVGGRRRRRFLVGVVQFLFVFHFSHGHVGHIVFGRQPSQFALVKIRFVVYFAALELFRSHRHHLHVSSGGDGRRCRLFRGVHHHRHGGTAAVFVDFP